ncbi:hypothetical protein [Nocardia sp. NPDC058497]|uniref:hypothetical protein n=1 Tax=Nocardia sp. NPDC058497 TaxID=3346529 RepID=UPI003657DC4E
MRIPRIRIIAALGASIVVAAGVTTACGGNPVEDISHTSGSQATIGDIELQNVHVIPLVLPGSCVIQLEGPSRLSFTATNTGTSQDRLVTITTDAADSVDIQAPADALVLDGGTRLAAGQPVEQLDATQAPDEPITVVVNKPDDWVRPGITIDVTFVFENAGSVEFAVPIDSCPTQQSR